MKSKFWLVFVTLLVIIAAGVVAYKFWFAMSQQAPISPIVNEPVINTLDTYTNEQLGFQLKYSKEITPEFTFKQFYALSDHWRAHTEPETKGTPVVAFPIFRIDQGSIATGKSYPLYFSAEVRVGVSADKKDVENCLKNDPGFSVQKATDVVIYGIPFKRFEIGDAAMMQYVQGVSYRTVHNNQCYAIEQLKAGSIYSDDSMKPGYAESELDAFYQKGSAIVQTFTFIK